jgi:hypothetical protein
MGHPLIFCFLDSSTKLDDFAAVALVGAAGGELLEIAHSFAFGSDFYTQFAAGVGFVIKRLR